MHMYLCESVKNITTTFKLSDHWSYCSFLCQLPAFLCGTSSFNALCVGVVYFLDRRTMWCGNHVFSKSLQPIIKKITISKSVLLFINQQLLNEHIYQTGFHLSGKYCFCSETCNSSSLPQDLIELHCFSGWTLDSFSFQSKCAIADEILWQERKLLCTVQLFIYLPLSLYKNWKLFQQKLTKLIFCLRRRNIKKNVYDYLVKKCMVSPKKIWYWLWLH